MPRSSTYADNVARWNAIPLTVNPPGGTKRARSETSPRSRSTTPPPVIKLQGEPDSSDEDEDDISLTSRLRSLSPPSPKPNLTSITSYDEYLTTPWSERELITVDTKIKSTNKGHALLTKLGWSDGQPLGLSKDGRVDPIPFYIKHDLTGLGKRAQDERMIESTVSQRRELVSERQVRESIEERQFREEKAARKEALANQIATTLRPFYCSLCDKQYQNVAQYDEHTNSYAHHHKQRFKDMQTHAKGLQSSNMSDRDIRLEKERKREEKELRRMAKARGVKVTSASFPSFPTAEQPVSSLSIPPEPSKGFKTSGWTTIAKNTVEQSDSRQSTIDTSSGITTTIPSTIPSTTPLPQ